MDYCSVNYILQGLWIQKAPTLFVDYEDFCIKLVSILNKGSFDLMLLLIEQAHVESEKLKQDMDDIIQSPKRDLTVESFDTQLKDVQKKVQELEAKLKETKL